jgi:hypothetical protein
VERIDDKVKKKVWKYAQGCRFGTKISQYNEQGEGRENLIGTMESIFGYTSDSKWNSIIEIEWNLIRKFWGCQ